VRVKTVTFVYSPEAERDVERLASTIETMAAGVDGVVTRIA